VGFGIGDHASGGFIARLKTAKRVGQFSFGLNRHVAAVLTPHQADFPRYGKQIGDNPRKTYAY